MNVHTQIRSVILFVFLIEFIELDSGWDLPRPFIPLQQSGNGGSVEFA